MFGAVGDGITDDSDALQLAIDSNVNKIVGNSENVYSINNTVILRSNLNIKDCKFFQPLNAVDRIIFDAQGTTVDQVMPSDIAENSFEIEVDDPSAFSVDQVVRLRSDELWSEGQDVKYGELVLVKSISGNILTLKSSTFLSYDSSQTGRIRAVTPVENVTFKDCEATTEREGNSIFVQTNYARNIKIDSCKTYGFDYSHYYFSRTYDSFFLNCEMKKTGAIDGSNYGIVFGNSCYNANVFNCYGDGFRHYVTVGSANGVNRFVTVDNCTITNSIDAGLDTHAAVHNFRFTNNDIYISSDAASGVRDGIVTQGTSGIIKNNVIYEARSHGISYFNFVTPDIKKSFDMNISSNRIVFAQSLESNISGLENAGIDIWVDRDWETKLK
jgi:hypothetical protein